LPNLADQSVAIGGSRHASNCRTGAAATQAITRSDAASVATP
jgi:hypothetical protein